MASGTTPLLQTNNISEAVIYRQALNDFYNKNVKVGEDGRVLHEMYLWEVKNSSESKDKYDLCEMVASVLAKTPTDRSRMAAVTSSKPDPSAHHSASRSAACPRVRNETQVTFCCQGRTEPIGSQRRVLGQQVVGFGETALTFLCGPLPEDRASVAHPTFARASSCSAGS
jgi:hypothetical protein